MVLVCKIKNNLNSYIGRERNYVMRKNGFTLAEVLITLSIIGVVAVLTLPSLITNIQDAQARTAVKKVANTLTEIANMSMAQEGYDFSSGGALAAVTSATAVIDPTTAAGQTTAQMLRRHGSLATANDAGCLATFTDGTCIVSIAANGAAGAAGNTQSVVIDINGGKAPNRAIVTNANGQVTTHGDRVTLNIRDGHVIQAVGNTMADSGFWALH